MSQALSSKILAIEDDPEVLALYKTYLQKRGYDVISACGAVEGMHLLRDNPDTRLILLDLNLPKKDGREVLQEIKTDDALKRIPVVVLTTSKAEEDVLRTYNLHANCYVTKPVDLEKFMVVVKTIDVFWLTVVTLPPGGQKS